LKEQCSKTATEVTRNATGMVDLDQILLFNGFFTLLMFIATQQATTGLPAQQSGTTDTSSPSW